MERRDLNDVLRDDAGALDRGMSAAPIISLNGSGQGFEDDELESPRKDWPVEVLPARFEELARVFAGGTKAPIELAALPMLAVTASALGPKFKVRAASLSQPARLWFAMVAPPGSSKSPTASPIWKPLEERQKTMEEVFKAEHREWKAAKDRARREKVEFLQEEPKADCCYVTDTTMEKLAADLAIASRGIFWRSDELVQMVDSLDGYSKSGQAGRARALSLWGGESISYRRKSGDQFLVQDPYAVIYGGATPSGLSKMELSNNDGLASRFLWARPLCQAHGLGERIPPEAKALWRRFLDLAFEMPASDLDLEAGALKEVDRLIYQWSGNAIELDEAGRGLIAGVYGKAGSQLARLASLLYGIDRIEAQLSGGPQPELGVELIARAEALVSYHISHARHVILSILGRTKSDGELSRRDLAVIDALKRIRPQREEKRTGDWVELLKAQGIKLSASSLGRCFSRISADLVPGLSIERAPRTSKGKRWIVEAL